MGWKFDKPLDTLTTEDQNKDAINTWEGESLGGIMEDNNRLPQPVVGLLVLTIITAFMITFPLWGKRPTAAIFAEYVALMDTPQVQSIADDAKKMEFMVDKVRASGSEHVFELDRHPITMDDLRMIKDDIIELQRANVNLLEYTVLGNKIVLANFEGNWKPDGTRERLQPWWDKGYTIDIFFIVIFCVAVTITVKRLPPHTFEPDHTKAH
jgi:chorismate mutase